MQKRDYFSKHIALANAETHFRLDEAPLDFGLGGGYVPDAVVVFVNGNQQSEGVEFEYNPKTGHLVFKQPISGYITVDAIFQ